MISVPLGAGGTHITGRGRAQLNQLVEQGQRAQLKRFMPNPHLWVVYTCFYSERLNICSFSISGRNYPEGSWTVLCSLHGKHKMMQLRVMAKLVTQGVALPGPTKDTFDHEGHL